MATTRWLQRDQTLPLSAKGVACETNWYTAAVRSEFCISFLCSELSVFVADEVLAVNEVSPPVVTLTSNTKFISDFATII